MTFHTVFRPDPARSAEWIARLWQGDPAPADFDLQRYLYLPGGPAVGMVFLWEGGPEAQAWFQSAIADFGSAETLVLDEATPGMSTAVARDLTGMETWLRERGVDEAEIERRLALRRDAMAAPTPEAAVEIARAWMRNLG